MATSGTRCARSSIAVSCSTGAAPRRRSISSAGSRNGCPISFVTFVGNGLRIPLAYVFALTWGGGGAGVYWAVNVTTYLKAFAYRAIVERGKWLQHRLSEDEPEPQPVAAPD